MNLFKNLKAESTETNPYTYGLIFQKGPEIISGKRTVSSSLVLGQLHVHMQESGAGLVSHIVDKVNSKWASNLSIRAKPIKLLEENRGGKLHDFGSLEMAPKA